MFFYAVVAQKGLTKSFVQKALTFQAFFLAVDASKAIGQQCGTQQIDDGNRPPAEQVGNADEQVRKAEQPGGLADTVQMCNAGVDV